MIYPVKYLHSGMRGAPTINGQAGSLLSAMDAWFTTGFGLVAVTGITVSGGVATATVASGNSFEESAIVYVEGATPAALNGEARVLSTTSTSFTFVTTAADGVASGSITAKYAPATGWTKVYSKTNVAVWQSTDVMGNRHFLRIDDTGTTSAYVRGYETMTDVDTGVGMFPTTAQLPNAGWFKSSAASAVAVRWKLLADSRFMLPLIAAGAPSAAANIGAPARGFGDPIALRPGGDAWSTLLSVASISGGQYSYGSLDYMTASNTSYGVIACPRAWQGAGSSVIADAKAFTGGSSGLSGADTNALGPFPSEVDGVLRLSQVYVREQGSDRPPRAIVPGVYYLPHSGVKAYIADGDIVPGSDGLAGRRLVAVSATTSNMATPPVGIYLVDATGPWR